MCLNLQGFKVVLYLFVYYLCMTHIFNAYISSADCVLFQFGSVTAQDRVAGQLLLRSTHIRSVRDLHMFFTTVANSAQSVDSFTCDQTLKQNREFGIPKSKSAPSDLSSGTLSSSPLKSPASQKTARMNIEKIIEADFLENMPRV